MCRSVKGNIRSSGAVPIMQIAVSGGSIELCMKHLGSCLHELANVSQQMCLLYAVQIGMKWECSYV